MAFRNIIVRTRSIFIDRISRLVRVLTFSYVYETRLNLPNSDDVTDLEDSLRAQLVEVRYREFDPASSTNIAQNVNQPANLNNTDDMQQVEDFFADI
jgi:hypothetical protein